MKGGERMSNEEMRTRVARYRTENPVSLSRIGCFIGLDSKHRYVLSRFMRGGALNTETAVKLSEYLASRGYWWNVQGAVIPCIFLCHKCNLKKILKERWLGHCLHNAFLLGIVMQKVGWELLNVPKHWQNKLVYVEKDPVRGKTHNNVNIVKTKWLISKI